MMQNRTFIIFLTLGCVSLAYALGYFHGQQASVSDTTAAMTHREAPVRQPTVQVSPDPGVLAVPVVETNELADLLEQGAWFQLQRWLQAHTDELDDVIGAQLVTSMQRQVNKYDSVPMRRVLQTYLLHVPQDINALYLLSDLQQMSGLPEAALESLFQILDFAVDGTVISNTMKQARVIVSAIDLELKTRGALEEREAFWRHISQRVSRSDYFRYEWAKALSGMKKFDEALRVLAETGNWDVSQSSLDKLIANIELASDGLQFERDGDRLTSIVTTANGLNLTLLVDTGANVTSFTKSALRALAARRTGADVQVQTAGGIITAGVYQVDQLEVQGVVIEDLRVIELPTQLPNLDGLLGLDVLNKLSIDALAQ